MKDVNLYTFPSSRAEALTMLYLQNQDMRGSTPETIVDSYFAAYKKIVAYMASGINSGKWEL